MSSQVPESFLHGPLVELVNYLTSDIIEDVGRIRGLFTWLATSNSQSSEKKGPEENSALDLLYRIEDHTYSHATLFAILCR